MSSFVNKLESSRCFYGYTPALHNSTDHDRCTKESVMSTKCCHETLHSLLLSLLPLLSHKFKIGCDISDIYVSNSDNIHFKILETALNTLRSEAQWSIPYVSCYT